MYFDTCPVHEHHHSEPTPAHSFRFLDLPPEIRNRIASLVLSDSSPIRVRHTRYNRHEPPAPEPLLASPRLDYPLSRTPTNPGCEPGAYINPTQALRELQSRARDGHSRLALLMTCRRAYIDHWATYYRNNEFSFTPGVWDTFRQRIPEKCLNEMRYIYINMPYRSRQMHVWRSLAELKSLERITVLLAPAQLASKLERASCVAGAEMCRALRQLKIERDELVSMTDTSDDDDAVALKRRETREDEIVERCVNEMLEERWRSDQQRVKRLAQGLNVRKATSRAGSEVRMEKRVKRRGQVDDSPTPNERAMDAYFRMVDSAEDEEGFEEDTPAA